MIYLDNASTTFVCDEAKEQILNALQNYFGNPSSLHSFGLKARNELKKSRKDLSKALGCEEREIIFTSCATESINTVLKGFFQIYPRANKRILTSKIEHNATLKTCNYLKEAGIETDFVGLTPDGLICEDELIQKLKLLPGLISLMHVNNETGAITDIKRIASLRDEFSPESFIHIDAAQSLGKLPINTKEMGINYLSASSHKLHGPKGVGVLFVNKNAKIIPLLHGGGQEDSYRSGTENTPCIFGFSAAMRVAHTSLEENLKRVNEIRDTFLDSLIKNAVKFQINSPELSSPYILNISFFKVKAEVLVHILEREEIYISTGSACSDKKKGNNRILVEMGLKKDRIESSVRISFSRYTTKEDVIKAAAIIKNAVLKF